MSMSFYLIGFLSFVFLISCFFIVKQQTAAIIERFGRYQSIRQSGLQLKIPLFSLTFNTLENISGPK